MHNIGQTRLDKYLNALKAVFQKAADKREAHHQSRAFLADMAGDATVFNDVLRNYLSTPRILAKKHYPVVAMDIELNAHFGLVANCWVPLPGRETDISTKALHHHGNMLLTTATAFGPGYEHWMCTNPIPVSPDRELFSSTLIERGPHPQGHIAFVDSYVAHIPFYPPSLTVTFALWSNVLPTTWRDQLKRFPIMEKNKDALRRLALRAGLKNALDIKTVDYFDFYPTNEGLKGMKERREFELGPNSDHLHSLFYIVQQTGNESLAEIIETQFDSGTPPENHELVKRLLGDLKHGRPIEGRLSASHFGIPHANFTRMELAHALNIQ